MSSSSFCCSASRPAPRSYCSTRADPPLPLGRLRAAGEMAEIRMARSQFHLRRGRRADPAGGLRSSSTSRPWPTSWNEPKGGQPGCTWRPCLCAAILLRGISSVTLPAATAMSWITWLKKSSAGSRSIFGNSFPGRLSWAGSPRRSATRSPERRMPGMSSAHSNARTCSSSRWMTTGNGSVTTTCSPSCSWPSWPGPNRARFRPCISRPAPGTWRTDRSTRPWATHSRRETWPAR